MKEITKWLVIGVLGSLAFILLLVGLVIWKFTPVVKIDSKTGQVQILGGLIELHDENAALIEKQISEELKNIDKISPGKLWLEEKLKDSKKIDSMQIQGQHINEAFRAATKDIFGLRVDFESAKLKFETSTDKNYSWRCSSKNAGDIEMKEQNNFIYISLNKLEDANCIIRIVKSARAVASGANADLDLYKAEFHFLANLANAVLSIDEKAATDYNYHVQLINGMQPNLPSSKKEKAYKIEANISNGMIRLK